jgi:regulator of sigma E protease
MGMEIMGGLSAFGGGLVGYVVPFLFVLTIVVFFHELGHFLMARWCGIKVLVFSVALVLRSLASTTAMGRAGRFPPFRSVAM